MCLFWSLIFARLHFNLVLCILSLTCTCGSPLLQMPAVLVNSTTNCCYQTTDGGFSFSVSPEHEAVFLAVLWRDLHKAEFLIASLQGARLDSASHPFFFGRKRREISETVAKRISAYAWSPLQSLSNKRRSFNLVTTGAFHYTPHAGILARKITAPPNVLNELSDLGKFVNMTRMDEANVS